MELVDIDLADWSESEPERKENRSAFTSPTSQDKYTSNQKNNVNSPTRTKHLDSVGTEKPTLNRQILHKGCCSTNQENTGRYLFFVSFASFLFALAISITALVGILLVDAAAVSSSTRAAGFVIIGCGVFHSLSTLPGCVGAAYHVPALYVAFVALSSAFGGIEVSL